MFTALVGALVGSLIGLGGVIWQLQAKTKKDKRQLGANLLFHSQKIHDGYNQTFGPEKEHGISRTLTELSNHQDELVLLLRVWELAWDKRSFKAASRHANSAITYYQCAALELSMGSTPGTGELPRMEDEWHRSRERLIDVLSAKMGIRWWQIPLRIKAWWSVGEPDRIAKKNFKELMKQDSGDRNS